MTNPKPTSPVVSLTYQEGDLTQLLEGLKQLFHTPSTFHLLQGVLSRNVSLSGICTYCRLGEKLFSEKFLASSIFVANKSTLTKLYDNKKLK